MFKKMYNILYNKLYFTNILNKSCISLYIDTKDLFNFIISLFFFFDYE